MINELILVASIISILSIVINLLVYRKYRHVFRMAKQAATMIGMKRGEQKHEEKITEQQLEARRLFFKGIKDKVPFLPDNLTDDNWVNLLSDEKFMTGAVNIIKIFLPLIQEALGKLKDFKLPKLQLPGSNTSSEGEHYT